MNMTDRPNILFLLSDQHNPGVLGRAENGLVRTPNLDRLADEGVLFDRAYCQNPLCVPSRSSFLTGRYSRSIGIYTNSDMLEPGCCTIPHRLADHGYRTCQIGKAHFNGDQFHGYQERPYGDLFGQAHQPDPRRPADGVGSGLGSLVGNAGPSGIPLPLTQTEICVSEAAKWLQTHVGLRGDEPFFLTVGFDKPHFPVRCQARYFSHYEGRVPAPQVPEGYAERAVPFVRKAIEGSRCTEQEALRYLAAYYGCVEWIDNAIGRILQVLEYLGLAENTIVIYTSDHGDLGGAKGAWNKTLFFDASARVPLIVRCPSRFPGGRRVGDLTGLIDLFPTLCEAAGAPVPDACEGASLMPVLQGTGPLARDRIFCESAFLGEPTAAGCMMRTEQWKYALYLDGAEELYDLAQDPGEWRNLAAEPRLREVADALRAQVHAFWEPDKHAERLAATPRVARQKHWYPYSNQFLLGGGTMADARP